MKLPVAIQRKLDEIEKDCLKLKRNGNLTEYGQGQLDLIRILRAVIVQNR